MNRIAKPALAVGVALWSAGAAAADISTEAAISKYCETLVSGASARQVESLAATDGWKPDNVAGQRVMRRGELLVGLSDSPRVCFVQAPAAMTRAQGFLLADAWGRRTAGAVRAAATTGPDGAPVRAWRVPARKIALIATEQTTPAGAKVMAFILMPAPN
ncbi:MAG TPA: hypothetical protein VF548_08650 [Allosphingosinicella sp.]|jgi:hypothetical protein